MASERNFYEHTLRVTVLTEDGNWDPETLADVHHDIDEGDCVGSWRTIACVELNAMEAAKKLRSLGSEPEFFRLDEDGNDLPEDE